MKSKFWQSALCAAGLAAAMAAPALAAVVTFENPAPGSVYSPAESYVEGGFTFTVNAGIGVIDTSAAFGPGTGLDLAGPNGNASQFFIGLNDASLNMRATDYSVFRLAGFDFGFVSALTNLFFPGDVPGQMVAAYETGGGAVGALAWDFGPADGNGEFSFQSLRLADMGVLASGVRQIEFFACTFDALGACSNLNANFSQFALDNLNVPEPGSLALVVLALGIVGGLRSRRFN